MKLKHLSAIFFFSFVFTITVSGQNTVGVLTNTTDALNGFTLFTYQKETYLINNCGEIINQWTSLNNSGKSVYLLENGNLLRASQAPNPGNIAIKGVGGRIELFNWEGSLIWSYDYATTTAIQHHDIFPMPNGNVLILAASVLTKEEAIQMGRNPEKLTHKDKILYNEQILELEPVGSNDANIIWQWDIKDHLIQDFDNTKYNFGVVKDNPQLLDINYIGISKGGANWLHINSIQYNAQLDQILLSVRQVDEFYIIDHSTTTAEAASHSGGTYKKGGDLLYRWGNPIAYGQGTADDQKLFAQHLPLWIPDCYKDEGKIILFNNGLGRTPNFSEILIINPPVSSPGFYTYDADTAYGPLNPDYNYTTPIKTDFYSPIMSGAQRLPNGNTLICEATSGHFFEIDTDENIVWEYINPIGSKGIMTQGDNPKSTANNVFRVEKFATDYPAFYGRDLTPGLPIEFNPDLTPCSNLNNFNKISFYSKLADNVLFINTQTSITKIEVYDLLGKLVKTSINQNQINLSNLKSSLYFIKLYAGEKSGVKKLLRTKL